MMCKISRKLIQYSRIEFDHFCNHGRHPEKMKKKTMHLKNPKNKKDKNFRKKNACHLRAISMK
jgi:hypothetical protein